MHTESLTKFSQTRSPCISPMQRDIIVHEVTSSSDKNAPKEIIANYYLKDEFNNPRVDQLEIFILRRSYLHTRLQFLLIISIEKSSSSVRVKNCHEFC